MMATTAGTETATAVVVMVLVLAVAVLLLLLREGTEVRPAVLVLDRIVSLNIVRLFRPRSSLILATMTQTAN
jgi:hypothetical protein